MLSNVDLLGKVGCLAPLLANAALESRFFRGVMSRMLGLSVKRPLPHYARERFDHWFVKRGRPVGALYERRKNATVIDRRYRRVILWDDTFVRYNEPHIGIAATKVLEGSDSKWRYCRIANTAAGRHSAREICEKQDDWAGIISTC